MVLLRQELASNLKTAVGIANRKCKKNRRLCRYRDKIVLEVVSYRDVFTNIFFLL